MKLFFLVIFSIINLNVFAQKKSGMSISLESERIIREFLVEVRSGKNPDNAQKYMSDTVLAHQINSENPVTVKRTPKNYADHIKSFLEMYGTFSFEITEIIAGENKVYVRWKQVGKHLTEIDGYKATQLPLIEYASAVYRLEKGKIMEYWIQIDRLGFEEQLKRNASK